MPLSAVTPQSSKYTATVTVVVMAGAITVAEVITMAGVEAIIMDGAIITIGPWVKHTLSSGDYSERGRLGMAFSLSRLVTGMCQLFMGHLP
jgi:hypothetical protein